MESFNQTALNGEKSSPNHVFRWEKVALLLLYILLSLVIIIGNALVLFAYIRNNRLHTGTYKFLTSLALSDFLVGAISLPMWIYISSINSPIAGFQMTVYLTLDIFSSMASISHLMAISLERFFAISKPFLYHCLQGRQYNCALIIVWLYGAFVAVFFPVQKQFGLKKMYATAVFFGGFALPLSIISSMYIGTFIIAKRLIKSPPPKPFGEQGNNERKQIQKEYKIALTFFIITGLFFLLWLPQFTTTIAAAFGMLRLPLVEVSRIVTAAKFLHYLNSALNPFIYAYRDAEIRHTFKKLLKFV